MDAIVGDRFLNGRRLRPATYEYALEQFPRLIFDLKTNKLKIVNSKILSGKQAVWLHNPNVKRNKWVILESDFIKCRDIAGQVVIPLFPNETHKMILDRIAALVKLVFAE